MNGENYIDAMPEDIREKWIDNQLTNGYPSWRKRDFYSFRGFINSTLNWELTNEGHEYWARINKDDALITKIERDARLFELGV
jgi:hypothetical protein